MDPNAIHAQAAQQVCRTLTLDPHADMYSSFGPMAVGRQKQQAAAYNQMNAGAVGIANGPQVGILGVKGIPYQGDQMAKIVEVLGTPERKRPTGTFSGMNTTDTILSFLRIENSRTMARYRSHARLPAVRLTEPVRRTLSRAVTLI